ncbi:MAG: SCO family protein [Acidobacteriota bacterium]
MIRFTRFVIIPVTVLSTLQCGPRPREYPLRGQILAVNRETKQLTIRHEDIAGYMPGMVMSFRVADPADVERRKPGELISATLVVRDLDSEVKDIIVTGSAPVDATVARNATTPVLAPGELVPEGDLVDEDGRPRHLSEWRGSVVLLTFLYTRCPLPDFCPRMERNYSAVQQQLRQSGMTAHARLIAVSFDPAYDTPDVLKKHAAAIGADPALWEYLTGDVNSVERFAAQFGVSIIRNPADVRDITHNLRTAVIAPDGKLVEILSGNEWTPAEAVAAIRRAYPSRS